jgi:fructosamine-3-kinase
MWKSIVQDINNAIEYPFIATEFRSINGGCINQAYLLSDGQQQYFVKLNRPETAAMFTAEAAGLREIAATQTITVPTVICAGVTDQHAYLALSCLDLADSAKPTLSDRSPQAWGKMGAELAALHQFNSGERFGWHQNNTIGSTPQLNDWQDNWVEFFATQRLGYQFQLAAARGGRFPGKQRLLAKLPEILCHQPKPSIVHGDLWGGNAGFTSSGVPVIFDPATYWGDREVDLAMTELFGGFPRDFYAGYESVYLLTAGYQQRKVIYNLYHLLNHYNLFGGSYEQQANGAIEQIIGS